MRRFYIKENDYGDNNNDKKKNTQNQTNKQTDHMSTMFLKYEF